MAETMMLGNQAVARGLWEAGCRFVSSYPGTPSTEITEYVSEYPEVYAEWAPNEKVAVEAAVGASVAGARAFSGMKHVGLNVAADPIFTAAYTGVSAGLVVAVADDQGMHSSQNEQDSRHYARAAKLPMLEPSDSAECLDFARRAFDLSEAHDTPVLLRLSTRVSHSQSRVTPSERQERERRPYQKDAGKYVMVPAAARVRHAAVETRLTALTEVAETSAFNTVERHDKRIGVVAAGIAYQTAREALGEKASYFKLGMIWPLPEASLRAFAAEVDTLFVIEELDDFIETHCRKLGLAVQGKALFSPLGEYTAEQVRAVILGTEAPAQTPAAIPGRPPVLCPGCPHRGLFHVLHKMKLTVTGDIGCYTLGASPPLSAIDLCICMGASVSSLHGFVQVRPEMAGQTVAVIGDSTFFHSGITGLINMVYNKSHGTVLILDNAITGMTGHQQNPATGLTLQGVPTHKLDIEALCRAVGVGRVRVLDPHDLAEMEAALREELAAPEPSVIVARRPCVLLPYVKRETPLAIDGPNCRGCRACMNIGCPAIRTDGRVMTIDRSLCVGCGLCARLCRFGAIHPEGEQKA
ncbi:MAG: indolepyruvate ferredoxin oxidoreductase subunit alpha [Oscillospiraceae bacterium]|nr:indolepyruvate ferredoxin oxidoreductase subunit alpha [Oscillospiraceae bacterium]